MATHAATSRSDAMSRDHRFFLTMAIAMAAVIVAGFSFQLAMGRSSFGAPWLVHVHALVFFGWVTLYVFQNALVATGSIALHRRLGWVAALWVPLMVVVGTATTVAMVRAGHVPFFFEPAYFLMMNPVSVTTFAALAAAAIVNRRRTEWHRRLMLCGMAILTGPAFGRLLPMPLMIPYAGLGVFAAVLIWPVIGIVADRRRRGSAHPAFVWGLGAIVTTQVAIEILAYSGIGAAIYAAVVAGSPAAAIPPLAYPALPIMP